MTQVATKSPVRSEPQQAGASQAGAPAPSLGRFVGEIDRLFDHFGIGGLRAPLALQSLFRTALPRDWNWGLDLATDLVEHDDKYEITPELPGIEPDDIELKLSNGVLTIKGEKKHEGQTKEADYHLSERHYGAFTRSVPLPAGVDAERIEAGFAKGVLTVKLPKTAEAKRADRKIAIKAA